MNWYKGTIPEAVTEAKRSNKILLVYIEGPDEMSQKMMDTYNNPDVAEKLSSGLIIALKLVANSVPYRQFCAIYPVLVIPSSFFIAGNGAPIEIVTGSPSSSDFCGKIDKLLESYGNSSAPKQENNSTPGASTSNAAVSAPVPSVPQSENIVPEAGTSQTSADAESSQSLEDKLERAKALIEAQRQSKALEEKEKEKAQEIERRNIGKAIQQAQQTKHDNELKEWAKNRAKEKEEERLAKEKVKAMIAQDRAERAAKYQLTKEAEQAERERQARNREEAERAMRNAAMSSNDARIQFRLPDGSYTTHCFSADASLEDARRFVIEEVRPPFSNFTLCTTFPRRHFTELNYAESLRDLQLAPSAVLLILPAQTVSTVKQGTGFLSSLIWMVLSPFKNVWNFIWSFLPGRSQESNPPPATGNPPNTQATTGTRKVSDNRQANERRRESPFTKREGNIFRINNQSDDEENNTWNGNSTQQM